MNKPRFYITDIFTSRRYGGNPLATFIDCEALSDKEMQQIAREINFSETTFITSRQQNEGGYDVRIFTPNSEVDFAGHPTLGTAYVIRNKLRMTTANKVSLNLRIGQIPVTFTETSGVSSRLWMQQMTPKFGKRYEFSMLAHILGIDESDFKQDLPIEEVSTGFPTLIVPLTNLAALKRIKINKDEYFSFANQAWAKIILVFSREAYESDQDLSVRVFADFYGIAEDAATGSSNGALAAYLIQHQTLGMSNINAAVGQGYEIGRPSTLALKASQTSGEIEVFVGGSVVEVAEGVWG